MELLIQFGVIKFGSKEVTTGPQGSIGDNIVNALGEAPGNNSCSTVFTILLESP